MKGVLNSHSQQMVNVQWSKLLVAVLEKTSSTFPDIQYFVMQNPDAGYPTATRGRIRLSAASTDLVWNRHSSMTLLINFCTTRLVVLLSIFFYNIQLLSKVFAQKLAFVSLIDLFGVAWPLQVVGIFLHPRVLSFFGGNGHAYRQYITTTRYAALSYSMAAFRFLYVPDQCILATDIYCLLFVLYTPLLVAGSATNNGNSI